MRFDKENGFGEAESEQWARNLIESGFQVIVYGEGDDPEVKDFLGWTYGGGVAILNPEEDIEIRRRKVALIAQKGRSEESFARFVSRFLARNIGHIYELHVLNTAQGAGGGLSAAEKGAAAERGVEEKTQSGRARA
jgi:hypothetical protein